MIQFDTPAVVPADPDANVTDLLVQRVAATPDSVLFSLPTADGGWSPVTTKQFHDQVVALAKGLVAAGIQPGDKIGLMCKTRYEWTLVDFATWFAGDFGSMVSAETWPPKGPLLVQRLTSERASKATLVAAAAMTHAAKPAVRNDGPMVRSFEPMSGLRCRASGDSASGGRGLPVAAAARATDWAARGVVGAAGPRRGDPAIRVR